MSQKKSFVFNLLAQLVVFLSNIVVNFFLTPYVLEKLGTEAYGFIGLINTIVGYSSIITVALNALAGRYITLAYHRGDFKQANEYYTSVFIANVLMSLAVAALSVILVVNISQLVNVPLMLEADVKIAVCLASANTIISLLSVVYGIAAFIKNKLYMNSIAQMIGSIVRVGAVAGTFMFLKAHLWYYALATSLSALVMLILQKRITKKLCPEFEVRYKWFRWHRIYEIVKEGAWVSLESLNKILQTGLDLLIANVFINPVATGLLSVAKTLPNVLSQMTSVLASVFQPDLARYYATGEKQKMVEYFRFSLRFMSMILLVPLIGFVVFGIDFFRLWLPSKSMEDILTIQQLSVLTVLPLLVNSVVEVLYYANTLTKKIRGSVLISFGFSLTGILVTLILLYTTPMDPLYIIAGTSSVFLVIRCAFVTPIYAACVLQVSKKTFFPALLYSGLIAGGLCVLFVFVEHILEINSWWGMLCQCAGCGVVGYLVTYMALFNKHERKTVRILLGKMIRRKQSK